MLAKKSKYRVKKCFRKFHGSNFVFLDFLEFLGKSVEPKEFVITYPSDFCYTKMVWNTETSLMKKSS